MDFGTCGWPWKQFLMDTELSVHIQVYLVDASLDGLLDMKCLLYINCLLGISYKKKFPTSLFYSSISKNFIYEISYLGVEGFNV